MTYRRPYLEVIGPDGEDMIRTWGSALIGVRIIDRDGDESDERIFMFTRKRPYMPIPGEGTHAGGRPRWCHSILRAVPFDFARYSRGTQQPEPRPMNAFIAVVLVCANGLAQEACDDAQALEVRKVRVANELGCATGWQEIIARTDRRDEIGRSAYLKTECRRVKAAE